MQLAFYKGRGPTLPNRITDTLIRWWTRGPYSHVELIFSDGYWFSNSPRLRKTRLGPVDHETHKWDFIEIEVTPDQEAEIRAWAELQVGTSYDWLGIFLSQIMPWGISDDEKWFCSELEVAALQQVGYFPGLRANEVHPNRLYRIVKGFDDGTGRVPLVQFGRVW